MIQKIEEKMKIIEEVFELTPREAEITREACWNWCQKDIIDYRNICDRLGVSISTVRLSLNKTCLKFKYKGEGDMTPIELVQKIFFMDATKFIPKAVEKIDSNMLPAGYSPVGMCPP